jgi:hypothetical protein
MLSLILSSDSHVLEPLDLGADPVDAAFQNRAPRIDGPTAYKSAARGCSQDKRQMRLHRRGTDGLSTHRWRKRDSNSRFPPSVPRGDGSPLLDRKTSLV